jgi:hypothetical protein
MRELTLLETSYLSGGLLLCVLLPVLMSFRAPQTLPARRACLRTVWAGQTLLAAAGLMVLLSRPLSPHAAVLGLVSYLCCATVLFRQLRTELPGN